MSLLPWHVALAERLQANIARNTLPHALLVTGPPGWGEVELANWMALELLGVDHGRDASTLAHADLRWVVPDGAVIKVDAVREVVAYAQGTPQSGPRKVAVLADAHCLNTNAANALLKTLEEPPAGTHLLLSTCHPGRLPPTLRSRCQALTIRPDVEAARRWLAERTDAEDLEARLLEYGGAPLPVLAGLESGEVPLAGLLTRALGGADNASVVKVLLEAGLADALGRWYRYLPGVATGAWRPPALARVAPRDLMAFADEITWARRQLVSSNSTNERLMAERVVARWRQLVPRAA